MAAVRTWSSTCRCRTRSPCCSRDSASSPMVAATNSGGGPSVLQAVQGSDDEFACRVAANSAAPQLLKSADVRRQIPGGFVAAQRLDEHLVVVDREALNSGHNDDATERHDAQVDVGDAAQGDKPVH